MRQHPLSFLFLLAILFALPNFSAAQMAEELVESLHPGDEKAQLAEEMQRIKELTSFGPHSKSPLAAGRLLTINRNSEAQPVLPPRANLFGPAYKNRRSAAAAETIPVPQKAKKQRTTGPSYKNRGAKTGGGRG
jgi:hypothetical protein